MDGTVIVAVISFAGTLVGTAGGIIASSKLTEYRLGQLEKKADACIKATSEIPVIKEKISNVSRRVYSLESREKQYFGYLDGN